MNISIRKRALSPVRLVLEDPLIRSVFRYLLMSLCNWGVHSNLTRRTTEGISISTCNLFLVWEIQVTHHFSKEFIVLNGAAEIAASAYECWR